MSDFEADVMDRWSDPGALQEVRETKAWDAAWNHNAPGGGWAWQLLADACSDELLLRLTELVETELRIQQRESDIQARQDMTAKDVSHERWLESA